MSDGWPKPHLVAVSGDRHDMPPKWDGVDVSWSPWRQMPLTTARFHTPAEPCQGCGNTDDTRYVSCDGRVPRLDDRPGHVRPRAIRFLAIRCIDCHTDAVWDETTGEAWTLDATDYSDTGSTGGVPA